MNAILPLVAALLQASSFTLDKVILSMRRVDFKAYTGASFPLIFLVTFVVFLLFRPPFSTELLAGRLGWFLVLSVAMTIVTNLFYYRALEHDALAEIQTLELLPAIPVVVVSSFLFSDERNVSLIIPAIAATLVIVWSHWEAHHFRIARRTAPFLIWAIIAAPIGAALSKVLLRAWSPISLELVRSGLTAAVLTPLFSKHTRHVPPAALRGLILTNILTTVAWIFFYFSYQRSGIIYTLLLFSVQPLLVYFAAVFLLKESFQWKKLVAFLVVLGSILMAQVIG